MSIPLRGQTGNSTYFITTSAWQKMNLLQSERMGKLLLDVLSDYQSKGNYLLHEFVVMPNHLHLLITPLPPTTLEKAIQLIKGGFSFRAKKELGIMGEIWQKSFYDRRVRDAEEYARYREYIWRNPAKAGLAGLREVLNLAQRLPNLLLTPYLSG